MWKTIIGNIEPVHELLKWSKGQKMMDRQKIIDLFFQFSKEKTSFELLESQFSGIDKPTLLTLLLECGVMPEVFARNGDIQ